MTTSTCSTPASNSWHAAGPTRLAKLHGRPDHDNTPLRSSMRLVSCLAAEAQLHQRGRQLHAPCGRGADLARRRRRGAARTPAARPRRRSARAGARGPDPSATPYAARASRAWPSARWMAPLAHALYRRPPSSSSARPYACRAKVPCLYSFKVLCLEVSQSSLSGHFQQGSFTKLVCWM